MVLHYCLTCTDRGGCVHIRPFDNADVFAIRLYVLLSHIDQTVNSAAPSHTWLGILRDLPVSFQTYGHPKGVDGIATE